MTAKRSLFGTDGVRGEVGSGLTPELATGLGRAAALATGRRHPQVLIVRDTRESGPMLEASLAAGIAAAGGDAWIAGVLPTPAAAVLTRRLGFDLAGVVSASHNPYADNGIKFLSAEGVKLSADEEARIEEILGSGQPPAGRIGRVSTLHGSLGDYVRALGDRFDLDLSGLRVILDCANGAAHAAAPAIYERLGAEVITINASPDGRNINDRCGSTDTAGLVTRMAAGEADIGFAFDGDADRVIAVDSRGEVRDGDEILAIAAGYLADSGELGGGVSVTVMTNFGFHVAMREAGIEVATTPVGDRHVLAGLLERDWRLGGEQSGHVICRDFVPTGDGIASSLLLVQALGGRRLEEARPFERMPQRLINVQVADRDAIEGAAEVWRAVDAETEALAGRGRVLLRPSGTEPLVRVMVEAPERERADEICERLAALVTSELGG